MSEHGEAPVRRLAPGESDQLVRLIVEHQADPARHVPTVGTEPDGIRAELDELDPDWTAITHVVTDGPRLSGAIVADVDPELGKAWLIGPWVDGGAAEWPRSASALLDAALAELPPTITWFELAGHLANTGVADLARSRGWEPTTAVHALTVDEATVAAWPDELDESDLATLALEDLPGVRALHDAEFPDTYAPAERIVRDVADGTWTAVVARDRDGGVAGYAAGRIQPDGEGYLDYVAVAPAARGSGLGRRLVVAITRRLVARSTTRTTSLTVNDDRPVARRLYEQLGFRTAVSFRGYRGRA